MMPVTTSNDKKTCKPIWLVLTGAFWDWHYFRKLVKRSCKFFSAFCIDFLRLPRPHNFFFARSKRKKLCSAFRANSTQLVIRPHSLYLSIHLTSRVFSFPPGVRYNAHKRKVGNYYTTPIYKFRMKCHLCDQYFEIQTDPKVIYLLSVFWV